VEDLMILDGISSKIASSIIEYRTAHGNFSDIEDIKKISGIGIIIYRRIKDYISVSNI